VKDFRELSGMESEIELFDLKDAHLVARFTSDASTGEFMVVVPGGREYAMHVRAKGYLFHSENIAVPVSGEARVNANLNIAMQPIEAGSQVVMRNIFFDRDKADLAPASLAELDRLLLMMRENPAMRIEVGGHTDSDGSASHNDELSAARARAVADHLIANGIREERLEAKGYGAAKPMAPNDTPENKKLNRRTEVKVL
jgi:outer membrane protein OmpA-like peptidoglycan-associated protein